jgi:elongation factor Ts
MSDVSAELVKALRDETNAGMMECKKALAEAKGDKTKALRILRERGIAIAEKKSSRTANQGVIAAFISSNGETGSLIEVNCETDFAAKNEGFRSFTAKLAEKAVTIEGSLAESAKAEVTAKIAETGENIVVRRNIRFVLQKPGLLSAYIHHGSTIGVLVEVNCAKNDTTAKPAFKELAKDICLHVAASRPRFLDRASVPPEIAAAEKEILAKQVTGKPPQIVGKIVEGKMGKFYGQVCLLEQPFVKDADKNITALLAEKGKELEDEIKIKRFERFQVGEAV